MKRPIGTNYGRKAAVFCMLAVTGAVMLTGCKKEKINPATTHTTAAAETMAKETEPTTAVEVTQEQETEAVKNVTAKKDLYENGKVSIEYPTVVNVEDAAKAQALDELLKANALAVVEGLGIDVQKDDLDIGCQVMSADRSQITIVYKGTLTREGASEPVNVFYTSTVDVQKAENVRLSKYVDPYTLAGYVLSEDCIFPDAEESLKAVLMKEKNSRSLEEYTRLFQNADFSGDKTFPMVFSYEHEGNIYFSIPVSHESGDYALVMFAPDGK